MKLDTLSWAVETARRLNQVGVAIAHLRETSGTLVNVRILGVDFDLAKEPAIAALTFHARQLHEALVSVGVDMPDFETWVAERSTED